VSLFGVARSLIPSPQRPPAAVAPGIGWTNAPVATAAAWTGPIAVLALVAVMYGATIGAFELMHALPVVASGASGH
jgi:hypothetical protein